MSPTNTDGRGIAIGTFNLHAGVDGWGRPFDWKAGCRALNADIIVLQETWAPEGGRSMAAELGDELGYRVIEQPLVSGRRAGPHPRANHRWMRRHHWRSLSHALFLAGARPLPGRVERSARYREAEPGTWGLALLSRLPLLDVEDIDLGRLGLDRAPRKAIVASLACDGRPVFVVATHMPHLTYGSPVAYARLARDLTRLASGRAGVLAGDFNLWGPPAEALLPGWRRAVKGRTWPAWRPHSQVDHIMTTGGWRVLSAEVLAPAGSDHLPLRAHLQPT
jgi:endonuclease/exonuclease/phosphatase family metal-dependent hydrolase